MKRTSNRGGRARKAQLSSGEPLANQRRIAFLLVASGLLMALTLGANAWLSTALPGATDASAARAASTIDQSRSGSPPHAQAASPAARIVPTSERIVRDRVEVAFSIGSAQNQEAHEKHGHGPTATAQVRFGLADAATGQPLAPQSPPMAWLDLQQTAEDGPSQDALTCPDRARLFSQGNIGFRPTVDLNSYYILTLNRDASISVIDPLVGVSGMTQLYALVSLTSPGEDWVITPDQRMVFISMPQVGQLAVVDADNFTLLKTLDVGVNPTRLAMGPGGRYLWVSNDSPDARTNGVTVVDTHALSVVARIPTGAGAHRIVLPGDDSSEAHTHGSGTQANDGPVHAFVTNRDEGTLSVIDARDFRKTKDIRLGVPPSDVAFSSLNNAVYVATDAKGPISVVDAATHEMIARIDGAPEANELRFAPGGRWGFMVGPWTNRLTVLDASTNAVVHTAVVGQGADRITFSNGYAYVHATGTPEVAVVDLARLGEPDSLPIVKVNGGQQPPAAANVTSQADLVFPMHGTHALIANPADSYIYYYMEGMNVPMGGFQTYGHTPTAVRVVDRSLHEDGPGAYAATFRLPRGGEYEAVFLLDNPRIVNCFSFTVASDAGAAEASGRTPLAMQILGEEREVRLGDPARVRFSLAEARTKEPVSGIHDVQLVATLVSGLHSDRFSAVPTADGDYEAIVALRYPGLYQVHVAIPSRGVALGDLPSLGIRVTADGR